MGIRMLFGTLIALTAFTIPARATEPFYMIVDDYDVTNGFPAGPSAAFNLAVTFLPGQTVNPGDFLEFKMGPWSNNDGLRDFPPFRFDFTEAPFKDIFPHPSCGPYDPAIDYNPFSSVAVCAVNVFCQSVCEPNQSPYDGTFFCLTAIDPARDDGFTLPNGVLCQEPLGQSGETFFTYSFVFTHDEAVAGEIPWVAPKMVTLGYWTTRFGLAGGSIPLPTVTLYARGGIPKYTSDIINNAGNGAVCGPNSLGCN